ncbi:dihydrofolate reductase [Xanthomonas sp. NCPPB 1638]|uniref:Dihydrofolate reductase n=1 Tax=Xanthomonas cucurbitae TaxID=56453 RepID=A0A2S7DUL1_9XANT|nr:dihydrofolate reductase [Xanthomonas cucurbitae]PPU77514.1 diacylglycerol kinase [Xanthomonas cucurbitae]QHG86149.1 dihydrofolate reductase [Xanthomonas cucurbitae]WDM76062.1 dihydrofolate reductase [Xanthomonas cucurbitae]WDM78512.1 dihydrofolate reductase [Xanthomonas cucurbitae]WDM82193.1 dihydrofolate reductase [Xanthomonas cucurbitae]
MSGQNSRLAISLIVAFDRNNAIGRDNDLPWKLPDDLKRFKALTLGKPILMGRKTAQSLGRALPGRLNLVLTRSGQVPFEGMQAVASVDQAIALAEQAGAPEVCVIGGGEVYRLTLERADLLAVTEVDTAVEQADTHFPAIDPAVWMPVQREEHAADARHAFAFSYVEYRRR